MDDITTGAAASAVAPVDAVDAAAVEEESVPAVRPTDEDLKQMESHIKWMTENMEEFLAEKRYKALRRAIAPVAETMETRKYKGTGNMEQYRDARAKRISQSIEKNRKKQLDKEYLEKTKLRASRIAKMSELAALAEEVTGAAVPLIPDGAVETDDADHAMGGAAKPLLLADGTAAAAVAAAAPAADASSSSAATAADASVAAAAAPSSGAAAAAAGAASGSSSSGSASATVGASLALTTGPAAGGMSGHKLHSFRACYICKRRFQELHSFYDALCPDCASLNWTKRNTVVDLTGRVCLVTGARVKIGFHCALKLLRCGARVIATSRFPHDAAERFAAQPDFKTWSSRLYVFGLDMRDVMGLEAFCGYVSREFERLDAIVNNACQTVRRPPAYYAPMMAKESTPLAALADAVQPLVARDHAFQEMRKRLGAGPPKSLTDSATAATAADAAAAAGAAATGAAGDAAAAAAASDASADSSASSSSSSAGGAALTSSASSSSTSSSSAHTSSAHLSQVALVAGDDFIDTTLFPQGASDVNSQQIDLRTRNSWLLKMDEVSTPELAEVFAINAMAPYILNARLKPLMMKGREIPADMPPMSRVKTSAGDAGYMSLSEALLFGSTAAGQSDEYAEQFAAANATSARASSSAGMSSRRGADDDGSAAPPAKRPRSDMRDNHKRMLGEAAPAIPADVCRFVINVSAMEGKFHRHKLPTHPHTNMAKAALNMMTRTSAQDYADSMIFMTAVDTGWINDENPLEIAARTAARHHFQTPIDEIDAAARILDPMLAPLAAAATNPAHTCRPLFGAFLKDYYLTEW